MIERRAGSGSKDGRPLGLKLVVAFFFFGAAMCLVTILLLAFPESFLAPIWRIKPEARADFQVLGAWAFLLMTIVGLACALSAIGLARGARWGRRLALAVLIVNLLGDTANVFLRHDYRTLIGLPLGGALIWYLARATHGTGVTFADDKRI